VNGVGGGGAFHASACLSHLYVGCMKRGVSSAAVGAAAAAAVAVAGEAALGAGGLTGDESSHERGAGVTGAEIPVPRYLQASQGWLRDSISEGRSGAKVDIGTALYRTHNCTDRATQWSEGLGGLPTRAAITCGTGFELAGTCGASSQRWCIGSPHSPTQYADLAARCRAPGGYATPSTPAPILEDALAERGPNPMRVSMEAGYGGWTVLLTRTVMVESLAESRFGERLLSGAP
jgi:hypothetical protein